VKSIEPETAPTWFSRHAARNAIHDLIHPQAVHHEGRTYVVYQGVGYAPTITYYDHERGRWGPVVKIAENPLQEVARGDDHGAAALAVDGEGFLHVFYGSHGTPQKHARSVRPGEIGEWEVLADVLSQGGEGTKARRHEGTAGMKVTYPFPMVMGDGSLMLFLRKGVWPNPWFETSRRHKGTRWTGSGQAAAWRHEGGWSEPRYLIDFLPDGVYAAFRQGAGRTVHCTFVHQDVTRKPEWQNRRHCFYMKRDAEGTWRNVRGEALELPVRFAVAMEKCLVLRTDSPRHSNAATLEVDAEDRPYLLIIEGTAPSPLAEGGGYKTQGIAGEYRHRFAYWTGDEWSISDITTTDWVFDNAGAIDVSDPQRIEVYVVSGGSDATANKRGGNVERWRMESDEEGTKARRHAGTKGAKWEKVGDVVTFEQTGRLHYAPRLVVNGRAEGKIVLCTHPSEAPTPRDRFEERVYLWGDGGFVPRPSDEDGMTKHE
jgi:hypothetical protein